MTAVDTNVLVRLLTADEPNQFIEARNLFAADQVWIAKTVLLETSWVLQSLYKFEQSAVCDVFGRLLGLSNVHIEDEVAVESALILSARGIELADAIHLSSRPPGAAFVSFDRSFIRHAAKAGVPAVSTPVRR